MKTRARDRIRFPNGAEMTLGQAMDAGLLRVHKSEYYDPPRYFATNGEVSWEIRETLYRSRLGIEPKGWMR
jgi:hypothetical protein